MRLLGQRLAHGLVHRHAGTQPHGDLFIKRQRLLSGLVLGIETVINDPEESRVRKKFLR